MRHTLSFANCALVDAIAKNEKKHWFESKGTLTATLTTFLRQKLRTLVRRLNVLRVAASSQGTICLVDVKGQVFKFAVLAREQDTSSCQLSEDKSPVGRSLDLV
jgi:hypothetical protein